MQFSKETLLNVPAQFAFNWHAHPDALRKLLPPWENIKIIQQTGTIKNGDRVKLKIPIAPGLRTQWLAEHCGYEAFHQFEDVQLKGPFRDWHHTHIFEPVSETSCKLIDKIEYTLPLGNVGAFLGKSFVQSKLKAQFTYRHRQTKTELELHDQYCNRPPMRILLSGCSGLIGSSLASFLRMGSHEVVRLVRNKQVAEQDPQAVFWDPSRGEIERSTLEGFDAVIHLGGANIAEHRWTDSFKEEMIQSRVRSTQLLASVLATLDQKPSTFIVASAIGFYGDRKDEIMTEDCESGVGFLPEVGRQWEAAAEPARQAGIRVVNPRIGVVLTPDGAALKKMLTPFRLGLGGVAGSGKQYWSSISIHDVVAGLHFILRTDSLAGPVNLVMPQPVTNREFTKTLGNVLNRPTVFPLPVPFIKLLLGEMGEALLLESTRVVPEKLLQAGYEFQQPTLEDTFRHLLGR